MSEELIEQLREVLTDPNLCGDWHDLVGYLCEFARSERLNTNPDHKEQTERILPVLERLNAVLGETAL